MKLTKCASFLALAVFGISILACTGTKPGADAESGENADKTRGKVGDRLEAGGIALTVTDVSKKTKLGDFQQAGENNEYVVVGVKLETTDRDEAPYNPMYFKLRDGSGLEQNAEVVNSLDGSLKSGKLFKGDSVRGTVVFEMPNRSSGLTLSYEPMVLLGGYETLRVDLDE